MRSIAERLESNAEAWKPEEGAKLIGTVVETDERESKHGNYPLVVVETDDGDEIAVHCFHTVLKNEVERKRPEPGDLIGIVYRGLSAKGYESYKVVLERGKEKQGRVGVDEVVVGPPVGEEREFAGPDEKVPGPSDEDEPADADVPF
jgi:hypothetical protein